MKHIGNYYVYEHIRADNYTCFYVGKGCGRRAYVKQRNPEHDRIAQDCGMIVRFVATGLDEEDAFEMERALIRHYTEDLGYGILIGETPPADLEHYLTNKALGGAGSYGFIHREEWCKKHSLDMTGSQNPMFGINLWERYSPEKRADLKEKISQRTSGSNNAMFGISPNQRMTPEVYNNWRRKTVDRLKAQTGQNNPNYGNSKLHEKVKDDPELRLKYYSRPRAQNGRARHVAVYDGKHNFLNQYDCIGDCCDWIKSYLGLSTRTDTVRSAISSAMRTGKPYRGYFFDTIQHPVICQSVTKSVDAKK